MDEVVYFEDENVSVTSERVRLGAQVYPLADVSYASVVQDGPRWQVGPVKISIGFALWLLYAGLLLISGLLVYMILPSSFVLPSPWILAIATTVAITVRWLVEKHLERSGRYIYVLSMAIYPDSRAGF